jgi:hypothetical protein
VTQTGPLAPTTAAPAVPHLLTTTETPPQDPVGTVVTERRSTRENRGKHRCSVLDTHVLVTILAPITA